MTSSTLTDWTVMPSVPTARGGAGVAVLEEEVYVVGGGLSQYIHLSVLERYNATTETWLELAPMPTPRSNVVAASLAGKVYTVGGLMDDDPVDGKPRSQPSAAVEAFDPHSGSWARCADLPFPRVKPAIGAVDGKLYVLGGRHDEANTADIEAYDPVTDTWSHRGALPEAFRHSAAAVWRDRIYVFGGWAPEPGGKGRMSDSVYVFDPATGDCRALASMPAGRAGHAVVVAGGRMWVLGGLLQDRSLPLQIACFDPGTNSWSDGGKMPSPRALYQAAAVGETLFLPGGWTKLYKTANPDFLAWTVPA